MLVALAATCSFTSCEDVPAPYDMPNGGGNDQPNLPEDVIFTADLTSSLGDFKSQSAEGEIAWKIDHSSACITGYADWDGSGTKTNKAGVTYLVSPEIDLTGVENAYLEVSQAMRYEYNDINANNSFLVSTDYAGDVKTATWTQLQYDASKLTQADFTFVTSAVNLPSDLMGKKITVAFRHTCAAKSSTWEIQKVSVKKGSVETPDTPDTPDTDKGTETNPYNVTEAIAKGEASDVYVKGYVVGCVNDKTLSSSASFDPSNFTSNTNVLIAASEDETDVSKCMPVQLPSGAIRDGLNLKDNAANYKKEVTLYGKITKYFGVPGVKEATYAKIGSTEFGKKPGSTTPDKPSGETIYSETFASGAGTFTIANVELGGLEYVWKHSTYNSSSYMKGSAYANGSAHKAESWLVSASIDLSKVSDATLTFEQAINQIKTGKVADCCKIYASTNFSGDVKTATWEEITVDAMPEGTNWSFITSTASLKKYAGKTVRIAFRYTSSDTVAPTWEIKNVVVK